MSEKKRLTPDPSESVLREEAAADEPFFKRWSRLKADSAVRPPEPPVPAAPVETDPGKAAEPSAPGAEDPETLPPGDEDMPPIESLNEDSDFSGFMSPRVSAVLRKQALRKLFRSAKFNVISELDDYIDDYRNFPALGDTITTDMKHAAARLLEKQLQAAEAAEATGAAAAAEGVEAPDAEGLANVATAETGDEVVGTSEAGDPDDKPVQADANGPGQHEDDGVTDRNDSNERGRNA